MDNEAPVSLRIARRRVPDVLLTAELAVYYVRAAMLAVTAFAALASVAQLLWKGLESWSISIEALRVLDQLLIVLMLVEILHTVRISIRSHIFLAAEPFLIVGLIASIRRILIISLQMASLTREGTWSSEGASIFRGSMIELALLIVLVLVLVFSITLLRSHAAGEKELEDATQ